MCRIVWSWWRFVLLSHSNHLCQGGAVSAHQLVCFLAGLRKKQPDVFPPNLVKRWNMGQEGNQDILAWIQAKRQIREPHGTFSNFPGKNSGILTEGKPVCAAWCSLIWFTGTVGPQRRNAFVCVCARGGRLTPKWPGTHIFFCCSICLSFFS